MSREKIINAAGLVFSNVGYHKASMDDIAKAAGVAKGTLYYHFSSKAQLFKTLVTEGMKMVIDKTQNALNSDMPLEVQLKKIIETNINLYIEYSEIFSIFLNEVSSGIDQETLSEIRTLKDNYVKFIADLLEGGYYEGLINSTNYRLAAAGIVGILDGTCKYYLKNRDNMDSAEIRDSIFTLIFEGLLKDRHYSV